MQISEMAKAVKESSTLAISAKAKAMKAEGIDLISFGAGEPDFDTPQYIKDAAIDAINAGFTKYTASAGIPELRKAICKKLKEENDLDYEPSQIVVNNGAKHALTNTFMAILNPGDEVLIPAPYWLSYAEMVKIVGGVPKLVYSDKERSFKVDALLLEEALTANTKAIVINSPNNPTGMVYSRDELYEIGKFAIKHDLYIVSDEIYEHLIYDPEVPHISIASLGKEFYEHTVVINGVSKSYAMTGWRMGYTASSKELAEVMASIQSHCTSNINSITQKAALAALNGGLESVDEMRIEFAMRCEYIFGRISKMKHISMLKPQGAFYAFVDCSALCGRTIAGVEVNSATELAELLLEKAKIAVVPCVDFGYDKYMRLSYAASHEDIDKGLDRLEKFLEEYC